MPLESQSTKCGTSSSRNIVGWYDPVCSPRQIKELDPRAAQARERLLDDGRYVDVVTGDPEKDFYAVGRMWLFGG
jgi:hypothetical protein